MTAATDWLAGFWAMLLIAWGTYLVIGEVIGLNADTERIGRGTQQADIPADIQDMEEDLDQNSKLD